MGHFGYIQKVRGIPVRKGSSGTQFGDGAVQILRLFAEAINHRERVYAVKAQATLGQQARPDQAVDYGRLVEHVVRLAFQISITASSPFVGSHELPQTTEV